MPVAAAAARSSGSDRELVLHAGEEVRRRLPSPAPARRPRLPPLACTPAASAEVALARAVRGSLRSLTRRPRRRRSSLRPPAVPPSAGSRAGRGGGGRARMRRLRLPPLACAWQRARGARGSGDDIGGPHGAMAAAKLGGPPRDDGRSARQRASSLVLPPPPSPGHDGGAKRQRRLGTGVDRGASDSGSSVPRGICRSGGHPLL
ncbi:hypothetical protein PVAP13_3NG274525 [Panicum virgatum]|uniref:Uncharacterized protein n=1 Tax=Panicum virgatum TaxID=38727 RepID=A0A8T0UJK5_PANVG|nr:hypothetical protein PVAP13_3NG274525 [Panicum virgatum]